MLCMRRNTCRLVAGLLLANVLISFWVFASLWSVETPQYNDAEQVGVPRHPKEVRRVEKEPWKEQEQKAAVIPIAPAANAPLNVKAPVVAFPMMEKEETAEKPEKDEQETEKEKEYDHPREEEENKDKLCVIVPYRDRQDELEEFAPYLHKFLEDQDVEHEILVMNQTDKYRFNRASLINVGWLEGSDVGCTYMVMHDVDLLPANPSISYQFPGDGIVRHISAPRYHPKYHYKNFIGGILMLTMKDYRTLNGMSNKYWGWGLEDDEFFLRIRDGPVTLTRVEGLSTNSTNTFKHIHPKSRKRDYAVVTKDQKEIKRKRDLIGGLKDVHYEVADRKMLLFGDAEVRVIDVVLECDLKKTPYCVNQVANKASTKKMS